MDFETVKRSAIVTHRSKYNDLYVKLAALKDDASLKVSFSVAAESDKFYFSFATCLRHKGWNKKFTMHRDGLDVYISNRVLK
jgi:hypothetical protein